MKHRLITVAAMGLLLAGAAHAQSQSQGQGSGQRGANFIASWDLFETGHVSLDDLQTRRGELFDMFDHDGNGYLEGEELEQMAETVAAQGELRLERQAQNRSDNRAERQQSRRQGQGEGRGQGQGQGQGRGQGQEQSPDRNADAPGTLIHEAMSLAFNDADGDGRISRAEFLAASERLFLALDRNGDGRIDLDDF